MVSSDIYFWYLGEDFLSLLRVTFAVHGYNRTPLHGICWYELSILIDNSGVAFIEPAYSPEEKVKMIQIKTLIGKQD